ncbi:MAG: hypothetical protein QXT64_04960, partial [Desulfurococcaceae archaeon]
SQSPFPSTVLSDEDRAILIGMFKARGFTVSTPEHYIERVEREEKGRAETKVAMEELVRAFKNDGFEVIERAEEMVLMGKKKNHSLIGLKIHQGRDGKTRIMWKSKRLSQ